MNNSMANNSITNLDVSGLRSFYKSDATALHIFESLAARRNNWKMTTVTSLASIFNLAGFDILRKDILRVFRELEKFNCGVFIIGKIEGNRNYQSRFLWKVPPALIGSIAMGRKPRG
jgi:hypothetical protein